MPTLPPPLGQMTDEARLRTLLDRLLDAHREAFELGEHAAAYHALASAAHAAEGLGDAEALEAIGARSLEALAWLDANAPGDRFSTTSAAARGHHSVFQQLSVTATAMRQRLGAERLREEIGHMGDAAPDRPRRVSQRALSP